jgi:hypothetical protein
MIGWDGFGTWAFCGETYTVLTHEFTCSFISIVGLALTYLRLNIPAVRKGRRLLALAGISMVDIAISLLVTDGTGILAA